MVTALTPGEKRHQGVITTLDILAGRLVDLTKLHDHRRAYAVAAMIYVVKDLYCVEVGGDLKLKESVSKTVCEVSWPMFQDLGTQRTIRLVLYREGLIEQRPGGNYLVLPDEMLRVLNRNTHRQAFEVRLRHRIGSGAAQRELAVVARKIAMLATEAARLQGGPEFGRVLAALLRAGLKPTELSALTTELSKEPL